MTDVNITGNFTYRGDFVPTLPSGAPANYSLNDLVLFEGKLYIATALISGQSPDTSSDWVPWGNSRVSFRSTNPPDPKTGDTWVNTNTGRFYTFVNDGDTDQWVEL